MINWFEKIIQGYYKNKFNSINNLTNSYKVLNFKINGNGIYADVLTLLREYSVYIGFKQFSNSEKSKLRNLADSSDASFSILKNEIPENILNSDLKIYPTSMDDFIIECSF